MLSLGLLLFSMPTQEASDAPSDFVESVVRLPAKGVRVSLVDFTGDGRADLLCAQQNGFVLYRQHTDGSIASEPSAKLALPTGRLAWDVGDLDGDDVREIVLLTEAEGVRVYRLRVEGEEPSFDEGEVVLAATTRLPAGVNFMRFARDIDGDGRQDLVLPGSGAYRVHLGQDGGFAKALEIAYELDAEYHVGNPVSLSSSFGQSVRLPWFGVRDVDGDGRDDLVARTEDRVSVHLAAPELTTEPSWVLDLAALRAELRESDGIDFDNLFSMLDQLVDWRFADLDGVPPNDLIVSLGPKFRMYLGGARTGPVGTPDQVLKSSGNVLMHYVRNLQGSALPELQLIRAERISISRVVQSVFFASSLHFDVFTYLNESGSFSRHPTKRNRITLEVPRLLSFAGDGEGLSLSMDVAESSRAARLPRHAGAPAAGDDVLDVRGEELVLFSGRAPAPTLFEEIGQGSLGGESLGGDGARRLLEGLILEDLDEREDGAERRIAIEDIDVLEYLPSTSLQLACAGAEPDFRHPLAVEAGLVKRIGARDLDGDGRQDVIVIAEVADEWILQFLVRR